MSSAKGRDEMGLMRMFLPLLTFNVSFSSIASCKLLMQSFSPILALGKETKRNSYFLDERKSMESWGVIHENILGYALSSPWYVCKKTWSYLKSFLLLTTHSFHLSTYQFILASIMLCVSSLSVCGKLGLVSYILFPLHLASVSLLAMPAQFDMLNRHACKTMFAQLRV